MNLPLLDPVIPATSIDLETGDQILTEAGLDLLTET